MFPEMLHIAVEKKQETQKNSISGLQALIVSTATRVGMGNLVGVVAAISAGGAGAVFWMWVLALLGSSTAFAEATLAQLLPPEGSALRGLPRWSGLLYPCLCDEKRKHKARKSVIAALFALSGLICWCGISQVISNSVTSAVDNAFSVPPLYTTILQLHKDQSVSGESFM